jgi:chromosomal replication initiator protein
MFFKPPNPNFTFDNFLVGHSNRLAYSMCKKIASKPGVYNPLYLYGGVGLGKSYILHAVANKAIHKQSLNPDKVCLCSSEEFTQEVINSLRYEWLDDVLTYYETLDMFLFDSIQYLWGKERTQGIFFRVISSLFQKGKQIIVTSTVPPGDISEVDERIISFFERGFLAEIKPLEIELKIDILKNKAAEENIRIHDDALYYIATFKTNNIRVIIGLLMRIKQHTKKKVLTVDRVKELLKELNLDSF